MASDDCAVGVPVAPDCIGAADPNDAGNGGNDCWGPIALIGCVGVPDPNDESGGIPDWEVLAANALLEDCVAAIPPEGAPAAMLDGLPNPMICRIKSAFVFEVNNSSNNNATSIAVEGFHDVIIL